MESFRHVNIRSQNKKILGSHNAIRKLLPYLRFFKFILETLTTHLNDLTFTTTYEIVHFKWSNFLANFSHDACTPNFNVFNDRVFEGNRDFPNGRIKRVNH